MSKKYEVLRGAVQVEAEEKVFEEQEVRRGGAPASPRPAVVGRSRSTMEGQLSRRGSRVLPHEFELDPDSVPVIPSSTSAIRKADEGDVQGESIKTRMQKLLPEKKHSFATVLRFFLGVLLSIVPTILVASVETLFVVLTFRHAAERIFEYSALPEVAQYVDWGRLQGRLQERLLDSLAEGQPVLPNIPMANLIFYYKTSEESHLPMGDPNETWRIFFVSCINASQCAASFVVPLVFFLSRPYRRATLSGYLEAAWTAAKGPLLVGLLMGLSHQIFILVSNIALAFYGEALGFNFPLAGDPRGFNVYRRLPLLVSIAFTLYLKFIHREPWAIWGYLVPYLFFAVVVNTLRLFVLPNFVKLASDAQRTLFRVLILPLWAEPCLVAARCIVRKVPNAVIDKSAGLLSLVLPMLGLSFSGRVMLSSLTSPFWILVANVLLLGVELANRTSVRFRDHLVLSALARCESGSFWREALSDLFGASWAVEYRCLNLWLDTFTEYVSIFSSCILVYGMNLLADPSASSVSIGTILFNLFVQLGSEILTDALCLYVEIGQNLPMIEAWRAKPPQFLPGYFLLCLLCYVGITYFASIMFCYTEKPGGEFATVFC